MLAVEAVKMALKFGYMKEMEHQHKDGGLNQSRKMVF